MTSLIYFYGKNVIYQVEAADSLKNVVTVYIKTHCRQKTKPVLVNIKLNVTEPQRPQVLGYANGRGV